MIVGLDVGCAGITHDGDGLYLHGEGNYHQGHSVIQAGSNALTCRQISAAINEVVRDREASGLPLCLTAFPTEPQEFVQAADVTSWDESNTVCSTNGLELCSRAQLCPGYDPATMIDAVTGTMFNGVGAADAGHAWIAVADSADEWGAFTDQMNELNSWNQRCKLHSESPELGPRPCAGLAAADPSASSCSQSTSVFCCGDAVIAQGQNCQQTAEFSDGRVSPGRELDGGCHNS